MASEVGGKPGGQLVRMNALFLPRCKNTYEQQRVHSGAGKKPQKEAWLEVSLCPSLKGSVGVILAQTGKVGIF